MYIYIYITIMELIMLNVKCLVLSVVAGDIYSSLVLVSELLDAMVRLQGEPIWPIYFVCCKMLYALLQVSEIKALCMLCRHIYIYITYTRFFKVTSIRGHLASKWIEVTYHIHDIFIRPKWPFYHFDIEGLSDPFWLCMMIAL